MLQRIAEKAAVQPGHFAAGIRRWFFPETGGDVMRRRWFLLGMLSGLVLGVCATVVSTAMYPESPSEPAVPMVIVPTQPVAVWQPNGRPLAPAPIPPNWEPRYFNGQPYYIVPLESLVEG